MSGTADVSVVIPVFNGEAYVAEAIESLLAQSPQPREIIVVDDGSTDGSLAISQRYHVRCIKSEHGGISRARNQGIESARATFLAFLDADDLWVPGRLESQLLAFHEDPSLDLVFSGVREFSTDIAAAAEGNTKGKTPESEGKPGSLEKTVSAADPVSGSAAAASARPPSASPFPGWAFPDRALSVDALLPGTLLARRQSFLRVGFFDPRWRVGEFIDWYLRAQEAGLLTRILPDVGLLRRIHAANTTRTMGTLQFDYARLLKAALDRRRRSAAAGVSSAAVVPPHTVQSTPVQSPKTVQPIPETPSVLPRQPVAQEERMPTMSPEDPASGTHSGGPVPR